MDIEEAKAECREWIAHCDRQKEKTERLARLAADIRNKKITWTEGQKIRREIDGFAPTVRDGARLYDAVKVLLAAQPKEPGRER